MAQHGTVRPQQHQKVAVFIGMLASGACRVVTIGMVLTMPRFADQVRGRVEERRTQKYSRPSTTTCHDTIQTFTPTHRMQRRARWIRWTIPHIRRPLQHLSATKTHCNGLTCSPPCASPHVSRAASERPNASISRRAFKSGIEKGIWGVDSRQKSARNSRKITR